MPRRSSQTSPLDAVRSSRRVLRSFRTVRRVRSTFRNAQRRHRRHERQPVARRRRRVATRRNAAEGSFWDDEEVSDALSSVRGATLADGRCGKKRSSPERAVEAEAVAHVRGPGVRLDVDASVHELGIHHRHPPERAGCALRRRKDVGAALQARQEQQNRAKVHEQVRGDVRARWRWRTWTGTDEHAKGTCGVRRRLSDARILRQGVHGNLRAASREQNQTIGRVEHDGKATSWHANGPPRC